MPKYVASTIMWEPENDASVKFRAQVLSRNEPYGFELVGYWQKRSKYNRATWGFSLTFHRHCIRSYDMAKQHKNPGEVGKIRGPHKHRYSSSRIPRYAYKPNPEISEQDPNQGLMDFLKEANIEVPESYQAYMFY